MDIDIGISKDDRSRIAEGLSHLLADSYTLYLKTHNFHWNVTGPMFNTLHLMFEAQYTELALAVDVIAERIRALGFPAPGTYKAFASLTSIAEPEGVPDARTMIRELVAGQEAAVRTARSPHVRRGRSQRRADGGPVDSTNAGSREERLDATQPARRLTRDLPVRSGRKEWTVSAAPILIVGAGIAGYTLARALRRRDATVSIGLLAAHDGDVHPKAALSHAMGVNRRPVELVQATAKMMQERLGITIYQHSPSARHRRRCIGARAQERAPGLPPARPGTRPELPRPRLDGTAAASVLTVNRLSDYAYLHHQLQGAFAGNHWLQRSGLRIRQRPGQQWLRRHAHRHAALPACLANSYPRR